MRTDAQRLDDVLAAVTAIRSHLKRGTLADGLVFDPNETWLYDAKQGFSKSLNSPWSGQKLTGRVKTTIVAGKVVFANGKMV